MFSSSAPATFAIPHQPEYEHTQWAPMYLLMLLPGLSVLFLAIVVSGQAEVLLVSLLASAGLVGTAYSFRKLHVVDEGDVLAIRFGPIPVFRKRIPYDRIVAAEADRTTVVDGWGIHWVPGRGWTYNLWGFDCVRLTCADGRTIRVGTDDPEGLARFLKRKLGARQ
jgi:hypothetical protein